jgi:hypothetical protein
MKLNGDRNAPNRFAAASDCGPSDSGGKRCVFSRIFLGNRRVVGCRIGQGAGNGKAYLYFLFVATTVWCRSSCALIDEERSRIDYSCRCHQNRPMGHWRTDRRLSSPQEEESPDFASASSASSARAVFQAFSADFMRTQFSSSLSVRTQLASAPSLASAFCVRTKLLVFSMFFAIAYAADDADAKSGDFSSRTNVYRRRP